MQIHEIIAALLILTGGSFMFVSALGVIRLPDFYTRLHASSIGETFGLVLAGVGMVIHQGVNLTSAKILLIIVALFLVNPIGTHLIGKAAIRAGEEPWKYIKKEEEDADILN